VTDDELEGKKRDLDPAEWAQHIAEADNVVTF
jgi:hypothetical protein